jgi:inorganic pyrophosphatase
MNIWHDMPQERISPESFYAVIEISRGGKVKYELDKETGLLFMDRVLYTSTQYPANYGFIPRTYAADKDPLDVLVLCSEPLEPLSLVKCFPVGMISMVDSEDRDEKIIALPFGDPVYKGYTNISVYKALGGKTTVVEEVLGATEAKEMIREYIRAYQETYPLIKK